MNEEGKSQSARHTPGPWAVDPYDTTTVYGPSPKGRMRIADIRGWGHLTGNGLGGLGLAGEQGAAIQDANARLIAAAPELLEALKNLATPGGALPWDHNLSERVRWAEAAIAKAEGRQ